MEAVATAAFYFAVENRSHNPDTSPLFYLSRIKYFLRVPCELRERLEKS
jgi:hypothetical protein